MKKETQALRGGPDDGDDLTEEVSPNHFNSCWPGDLLAAQVAAAQARRNRRSRSR